MEMVYPGKLLRSAFEYLPAEEFAPGDLRATRLFVGVFFLSLALAMGVVAYSGATAIDALRE